MSYISQLEADSINTIADACTWAQVDGTDEDRTTLRGAIMSATGLVGTSLPRTLGVVPEADYLAIVNVVKIAVAEEGGEPHAPNLAQRGAHRIGTGVPPEDPLT